MPRAIERLFPFLDLRAWRPRDLGPDLTAAAVVTVLSIPQGLAYAMIAGLPPVVGLYASIWPAVVGGLFRSSRHVVAGPTNALSLLVGTAVGAVALSSGDSPTSLALTLAFLVGGLQLAAGVLRLGALADYISNAVVLGYVSGAGALIGLGQLGNLTGTRMDGRNPFVQVPNWLGGLGATNPWALGVGLGTTAVILALRAVDRRIPGALVAMLAALGASLALDLPAHGVKVIADLAPVPARLPPLTLPSLVWADLDRLVPAAVAITVLSLVESSSVARAIAAQSGDRVDPSVEFSGQGLANLAAAFTGGYPVSGSLGRSMANFRTGARTRLAGILGGLLVLVVVLFAGPAVDHTPIASLAGLLLILAWDLVDWARIRIVFRSGIGDIAAFVVTLLGSWLLDLDKAIYLGVAISVVLFLRRARLLTVVELAVDHDLHLREVRTDVSSDDDELLPPSEDYRRCPTVRVLHVEGSLFFGAASELQQALDAAAADPEVRVLVLRLKRCQGLDITTAEVLRATAEQLRAGGRHLLLVGMRPKVMERMEALGLTEVVGRDRVFPTQPGWFAAMDRALARAVELAGEHEADCPFRAYLAARRGELPDRLTPPPSARG